MFWAESCRIYVIWRRKDDQVAHAGAFCFMSALLRAKASEASETEGDADVAPCAAPICVGMNHHLTSSNIVYIRLSMFISTAE